MQLCFGNLINADMATRGCSESLTHYLAVSEDKIFVIPRCDIEREEETTETAKCQSVRNTDSYDKLRLHDIK
jgi:hypothetical protein